MKRKILTGIVSFLLLAGCINGEKQNKNTGYTIKGSIKGFPTGRVKLISYNIDDQTSKLIDSANITNGTFELKGKIGEPQIMTVNLEPGNWSFKLFIEDTDLSVTADTSGALHYDFSKEGGETFSIIKSYSETGSQNFNDWKKYLDDPGQKQYDPVFTDLNKKIEAAKTNSEQDKLRDQVDSVKKLLTKWQEQLVVNFITQHPSSVAGAYIFRDLYNYDPDMPVSAMESVINKFSGKAKSSEYYKSLAAILAKRKSLLPGGVAPDFTLIKRDSSKFTLSSTRGNYVLIDFWASWCHPCIQAIPHWKEVYLKYHNKGFEIVGVADDSRWNDWIKALDRGKMPWLQVVDEFPGKDMPAKVVSLYRNSYIPFYVLLDKEGRIILFTGDENKIDAKLKEIFGS